MRIITTLFFALVTLGLFAQVQYGQIEYLQTSEMSFSIGGEEEDEETAVQNKQIREMMAKMSASGAFNKNYTATFSPTEFNCVQEIKPPSEMSAESGGVVMVVMTGDDDPLHFYTNTENNSIVNKDMIKDKSFLVSGEEAPLEWTITGEKVAPSEATVGLDLKIATAVNAMGDTITAGYAPSMPVQVGPINYHGLPGAIITLEIPTGTSKIVYRATKITLSQEPLPISKPEDGKKISLEKFREEKSKRNKKTRTVRRSFGG